MEPAVPALPLEPPAFAPPQADASSNRTRREEPLLRTRRRGPDHAITPSNADPETSSVRAPKLRACQPECRGGEPRTDYKPGSVIPVSRDGDHLSTTPVSRRLQRPLTRGLDEQPLERPPIWSCSGRGLPGRPVTRPPVSSYLTISPLPAAGSPKIARDRRCNFCGTFLRVTPTGCYPAPCSVEPGLSSRSVDPAVTHPPRPIGDDTPRYPGAIVRVDSRERCEPQSASLLCS